MTRILGGIAHFQGQSGRRVLPKINTMHIHQLSVSHDELQDRLLLRVNTQDGQEMRFWLTRRMVIRLLPVMDHSVVRLEAAQPGLAVTDVPSQQLLTEFKRDAFLQTADFATPYKANPSQLPLGDEPLLVTDAQLNVQTNGHLLLVLQSKTTTTIPSCQLNLTPPLVHGMIHLIRQSMAKAEWALAPQGASPEAGDAQEPSGTPQPSYKH